MLTHSLMRAQVYHEVIDLSLSEEQDNDSICVWLNLF